MTGDIEKKIVLSWQQIVWGVSLISLILLTYSDLKNRVITLSGQLDHVYTKAEDDRIILELQQKDKELSNSIKVIDKKLDIDTGD